MSNTIFLPCMNGFALCVKDENLIVSTKKTEEIYPISKIQSITFKEPRTLNPGSITFRTASSPTAGLGLGFGLGIALGNEHNFFYQKSNYETALKLKNYITAYSEKSKESSNGVVVSVVEEIRGLKSLLDEGIITQEEFETKKKQLLKM